jgi:hypothetical protein
MMEPQEVRAWWRVRCLAIQAQVAAGGSPSRAQWHTLAVGSAIGAVAAPWEDALAADAASPTATGSVGGSSSAAHVGGPNAARLCKSQKSLRA